MTKLWLLKRLISILFLLLFLFHVGGYHLFFWVLHEQSDRQMAQRLDAEAYSADEVLQLKLPLTLPYGLNRNNFSGGRTTVEHNGEYYDLVKYKLESDTLYFIYIKNYREKELAQAMSQFAKASNDLATSEALNILGKWLHDFQSSAAPSVVSLEGWVSSLIFQEPIMVPQPGNARIPTPPPQPADKTS